MQAAGNDYVYVDVRGAAALPFDPAGLARAVSARRFSIGADGLVLICDGERARVMMRIFNADGSEGKMCGNAIRCVGRYLYENGDVRAGRTQIDTASGLRAVEIGADGSVCADMGHARFGAGIISGICGLDRAELTISAGGEILDVTAVDVGNPHAVVFCADPDAVDLDTLGPAVENHPLFCERVNVEFVRATGPEEIRLRVWERGSGGTLACGTGACAAVAAAWKKGLVRADAPVRASFPGGFVTVARAGDGRLLLCGETVRVCEGIYEYGKSEAE